MPDKKLTPATFLASIFGVGFISFAPGTFGTLMAVSFYLMLPSALFHGSGWIYFGTGLLAFSAAAVWLSTIAERTLGHDAPAIVIDEVCGYFISIMFLPRTLLIAFYALALFRAFDIAKPFPVNISQKLPKGWGVVADDLIAGIYTNIIIQIMLKIVPKFFGN